MSITFIEMEHDKAGNRWVLWSKGNYQYEVENRKTGHKIPVDGGYSENVLEKAREIFWLMVRG